MEDQNLQIQNLLLAKEIIPVKNVIMVAEKLAAGSPDFADQVIQWLRTGEVPRFQTGNWNVLRLQQEHHMDVLGALLTLSWLLRDPENAEKALREGVR